MAASGKDDWQVVKSAPTADWAPATTQEPSFGQRLAGGLQRGAEQFEGGLTSGIAGMGTRAAARAAGVPMYEAPEPTSIPDYINRGLGLATSVPLDAALLAETGTLATASRLAKAAKEVPAVAKSLEYLRGLAEAHPTAVKAAAAPAAGLAYGAATGPLASYGETGHAGLSDVERGAAGGLVLGALGPAVAHALGYATDVLHPVEMQAARELTGHQPLTAEGVAITPHEEGQVLSQTTPSAAAAVNRATATESGQRKLAGVLQRQAAATREALAAPKAPETTAKLANEPVTQAKQSLDQAVVDAQAQHDSAVNALGNPNSLPTPRGEEITPQSIEAKRAMEQARQAVTEPELNLLNMIVGARSQRGDLADVTGLQNLLQQTGVAKVPVEIPEKMPTSTREMVVSRPVQTKMGTLASLLGPEDTEAATQAAQEGRTLTSYPRMMQAEKEVKRLLRASSDPETRAAYTHILKELQTAQDEYSHGASTAYRNAYAKASEDLNNLFLRKRSIAPTLTQPREFTPREQTIPPADTDQPTPLGAGEKRPMPAGAITPHESFKEISRIALESDDAQAADDLKKLLGPEKADQLVGDALASQLKDASAAQVKAVLDKRADFLDRFSGAHGAKARLEDLLTAKQDMEHIHGAASPERTQLDKQTLGGVETTPEEDLRKAIESADVPRMRQLATQLTAGAKGRGVPQRAKIVAARAASQVLSDAITPLVEEGAKGRVNLETARVGLKNLSKKWSAMRKGLVDSGFIQPDQAKNIDTIVSNLVTTGETTPTAQQMRSLESALLPATAEENASLRASTYAAIPLRAGGVGMHSFVNPRNWISSFTNKAIEDAFFDPVKARKLAQRFAAARTKAQRWRIIAGSPALKALLAAHFSHATAPHEEQ